MSEPICASRGHFKSFQTLFGKMGISIIWHYSLRQHMEHTDNLLLRTMACNCQIKAYGIKYFFRIYEK